MNKREKKEHIKSKEAKEHIKSKVSNTRDAPPRKCKY